MNVILKLWHLRIVMDGCVCCSGYCGCLNVDKLDICIMRKTAAGYNVKGCLHLFLFV